MTNDETPNHIDVVSEAFNETLSQITPPRSTRDALIFIQKILERLPEDEEWGYVRGPQGGENVEQLEDGTFVRISRITQPDGQLIKVISNAPDGGPQWVLEDINPTLYYPFDGDTSIPNSNIEEDVENLKQRVVELRDELQEIKRVVLKYGDRIALRTNKGFYYGAEFEGVPENEVAGSVRLPGNVNATRTAIGGNETMTIIKP